MEPKSGHSVVQRVFLWGWLIWACLAHGIAIHAITFYLLDASPTVASIRDRWPSLFGQGVAFLVFAGGSAAIVMQFHPGYRMEFRKRAKKE